MCEGWPMRRMNALDRIIREHPFFGHFFELK
jgi:hypothetical protein